ncbi:MAG: hypothetical protein JKY70_03400 [Mucilaginibacter sp.]|nr:hypothetical protein [Mucilaginibacter sp.]
MWIPFTVFFLGYFLTLRKSQLDKRKESKIYRDMVITWISLAEKRTNTQAENCKKFAENLVQSEYIDNVQYLSAPLMYEKLNSINIDKSVNALVFNLKGFQTDKLKNFNKLIANINYLDKVEAELKAKYERVRDSMHEVAKEYNDAFIKIETIFFRKVNEDGFERGHKDFRHVNTINDFRAVWGKDAPESVYGASAKHTFEKLIKPSKEYISGAFNSDKSNKFLFDMYEQLNNMMFVERKWNLYKKEYSEMFKQYSSDINESYSDLKECIEFYKRSQLVSWWNIN